MKFRYSISEKWSTTEIIRVMSALEFAVGFYEIRDEKATLMCKLITGTDEPCEATADRIKGKRFELRLNRRLLDTEIELTKAVMHEMTHIKQFINDGLRLYSKAAKFQGKQYEMNEAIDYWFAPWEMEARAMEEPLYQLFEETQ
jgi:hypothetical protein